MTETIRCNFCGRTNHEAGPMLEKTDRQVRHRWVRICRGCAAQAVEVLGSQPEDRGEQDT